LVSPRIVTVALEDCEVDPLIVTSPESEIEVDPMVREFVPMANV